LTNKKYLPCDIRKPKFQNKTTIAYRRGNTLVVAWKDKRTATALTTWNNAGITPVKRILRGGVEVCVKNPTLLYQIYERC
jgi:hypothetical protein